MGQNGQRSRDAIGADATEGDASWLRKVVLVLSRCPCCRSSPTPEISGPVIEAYALILSARILVDSWTGDQFGRKRTFLAGGLLFTGVSGLSGLPDSALIRRGRALAAELLHCDGRALQDGGVAQAQAGEVREPASKPLRTVACAYDDLSRDAASHQSQAPHAARISNRS